MPLAETLAFSVGPVVAKWILKCWLKEGLTYDIASTLTDNLNGKIKDAFAAKNAAWQLDGVGQQVAKSLQEFFKLEAGGFDEDTQSRIAGALSTTLLAAKVDAALLFSKDLNSGTLCAAIQAEYPVTSERFSADEQIFYDRLLRETCKYIVEMSATLPGFQTEAFKAVIEKENELLVLARMIRDDIEGMRNEARRSASEASIRQVLVTCYRRAVFTKIHAQLSILAMIRSLAECRQSLQRQVMFVEPRELQQLVSNIIAELDAIERLQRQSEIDAAVTIARIDENDYESQALLERALWKHAEDIDAAKSRIIHILVSLSKECNLPFTLPTNLTQSDFFFTVDDANKPPEPHG